LVTGGFKDLARVPSSRLCFYHTEDGVDCSNPSGEQKMKGKENRIR